VGANIGSYTVLASRVCGAQSISVEPGDAARKALLRNLSQNNIEGRVEVVAVAVGASDGEIAFTEGLDTVNRVATDADGSSCVVPMRCLDSILASKQPVLIKIDVEGFEEEVVRGARVTLAQPSLLAVELETVTVAIEAALQEAGFERVSYDPFRRKLVAPTAELMGHNALFVRNRAEVCRRVESADRRKVYGVEI
jgi:FkbM family methyltransferase